MSILTLVMLAFPTAFAPDYISVVIVGKLISGICALLLALPIYRRLNREASAP